MLNIFLPPPLLRSGAKLMVLVCLSAAAACADDWPQFLGPRRDGVSRETDLLKTWPKEGPPLRWEKKVGEGFSGPVVAGEDLIVFHRVGNEEVVDCWNALTGKEIWTFRYPTKYEDALGKGDGPRSTPVIIENRIITLGAEGKLHCLDRKGTKVWMKDLLREYVVPPSFFGVGSSPLVVDGRVLVNIGGKGAGIVAFSLKDGTELWRATEDQASYASPVLYQMGATKRAVFFTRNGPVILDPASGKVQFEKRWRARIAASVNAATPLIFENQVFFSASYDTGGLILKLGNKVEEAWSGEEVMDNHYNTGVIHEGHLYGFHGRQETGPALRCVDLKTMKVCWSEDRFGCGALLAADGRLILLLETGELVLAEPSPERYREVSRFKALESPPVRAHPALASGRLYARDAQKVGCWDLRK